RSPSPDGYHASGVAGEDDPGGGGTAVTSPGGGGGPRRAASSTARVYGGEASRSRRASDTGSTMRAGLKRTTSPVAGSITSPRATASLASAIERPRTSCSRRLHAPSSRGS